MAKELHDSKLDSPDFNNHSTEEDCQSSCNKNISQQMY